jgi:ABC-2 type transport system ATP-binding protein
MLHLSHLARQYRGRGGVTDVTLTVPAGSIYVLCGANGSGKTTTLSVLSGLLYAEAGTLRLAGEAVPLERPARRAGLSYVPDTPVADEALTGRQWLAYVAGVRGMRDLAELAPYAELLAVEAAALETPIRTLSFGNRRKVVLLAELLTTTRVLLLDEPLIGLDPTAIEGFHAAARHFVAAGRSILFSTHLLREAEALATHVGILHRGKSVADGTLDEVKASGTLHEAFFRAAAA